MVRNPSITGKRFNKVEFRNSNFEIEVMGIKKLTPTSPSRRYQTYLTRDELTPGAEPEKSLLEPKTRISGRNKDRKSTRLNSSHDQISYAVFCLKKKKKNEIS